MIVSMQEYMRLKKMIPAGRWLRLDGLGTDLTQEKRRPARSVAVPAQKYYLPKKKID